MTKNVQADMHVLVRFQENRMQVKHSEKIKDAGQNIIKKRKKKVIEIENEC